jgi:alkanesulfonate monooxygenase SsuD/methylene tetrahydromethanopterin reductase-like flavin-dependent oxidoreductase (luciferase family)
VKFGLFYNPMVPRPPGQLDWDPGEDRKKFESMIEQIRFADSLGIDYVFLGEHHFMAEYAHNSATEVLLGVLATTTKRIRLGTGIVHSSHNDPVRIAERIAMVDVLSNGRMEFGFGPGGTDEIGPFLQNLGTDVSRKHERSDAAARIAADILADRGVWPGVANEFFDFPALNAVPKAQQRPHPPLWTSTSFPGAAPSVAERGLGQLMLTLAGPDAVAREVARYWDSLRTKPIRPIGHAINPAVFTFTVGLLAPTDEEADARAREGVEFFGFGLTGAKDLAVGDPRHHLWDAFVEFKTTGYDARTRSSSPPQLIEIGSHFADLPGAMMCGPEKAREFVRAIEATNSDGLLLNQQFGHTRHEHLMESLEIFATQVIPEFRDREAEHFAWREEQLREIELPIATTVDRTDFVPTPA